MTAERAWGKAVVVGGSYAGLVTARVLSDFFREVVLVERDAVDEDTGVHPGAPQGHHAHALLAKGGEILERLFPGLREELRAAGAPVFDYGGGIDFLLPVGLAPRVARAGVLLAVERNRWTCSLFGFRDQPPTDDDGYLAFARSLDNPRLAQQLGRRSVQEPTRRYTNADNQWRPYHSAKDWPDRLVAVGEPSVSSTPSTARG